MKRQLAIFLKRTAVGFALLAVVLILCRNYVARAVVARAGSYFLGNDVSVGRVNIGWNTITIDNFAIRERRLDGKPQLTVGQIVLQPTLWHGIRTGVWAERLAVSKVDAYLRFDQSGNLLSHFPSAGETEKAPTQKVVLPTTSAMLSDASVTIIQEGRRPLQIERIKCELVSGATIELRARIGELLGSSFGLDCVLDAKTFAGKTSFELKPLLLDCQALGSLPLAPAALKTIDFSAHVSCSAMVEHPANDLDLRNHAAALRVDVTQMQGNELAAVENPRSVEELYSTFLSRGLGDHISLRAIQRDGLASLHVTGPVASGGVSVRAEADLKSDNPEVDGSFEITNLDLGQVAKLVAPDMSLGAIANVSGDLHASLQNGLVEFTAQVQPTLSEINVEEIHVDPIVARLSSRGAFDTKTSELSGALDFSSESCGVDLAKVAALTGASNCKGRTSFSATASLPLATIADPNTYSAQAAVDTRDVSAEGFCVIPVQVSAKIAGGLVKVDVSNVLASVQNPNSRSATCAANLARLGDDSTLSFIANAECRLADAADPNCWTAAAQIGARQIEIAGQQLSDFDVSLQLADGEATLMPTEIVWQNTRCALSASGRVDGAAQVQFDASPVLLEDIARAASQFSEQPLRITGTARAAGVATLDIISRKFQANGYLQLCDAVVQGTKVGAARIVWSASPSAVQLQSSSQDFLGGRYACGAQLTSLDWTTTQVAANFSDIPIQRLVASAKLPAKLGGTVNGQVRLESIASLESLRASGEIATRDGRLGNVPFTFQTTQLGVDGGQIRVNAKSEIASGSIQFAAQSSIPALQQWQSSGEAPEHIPVQVRVDTTPILMQPLIAQLDRSRQTRDVRAAFSVLANRDAEAVRQGVWCTATTTVDYLGYRNAVLANRLRTDIVLRPSGVQLRNIGGKIAGGALQGEIDVSLGGNLNGRYRLSIEGMNLRRALAPVPNAARSISGTASIAASGRIGDLTTANVRMKASNVVAGGLAIREMRMPLTADYQLQAGRATWRTRGATAQVGGGMISLDSEGNLARNLASFTSNVKIARVDTTKMLRGKSINAGIIDGTVSLRARRASAPEDIVGGFHIQLSQMQGFEIPGFDQLLQIAKMPSFTTNKLGENDLGIVDGRIGGGLVRIDEATLSKSGILVLMNGTSTLSGRLNLDVTAITNPSGPADGLVDLANSPLMLAAPAPVALIAKANDAMKDRVIYVAVTGVASRPTLHVQPGKSLSQDALRFVLSTAIGNQSANLAVRRPSQESNR